jgi:4-deoxy-L-threo-5-hexosulose-uronate ketol-isomerase
MEIRYSVNPEHAKRMTSEEMRREFHINNLFGSEIKLVYSHVDRVIVGGVAPRGQVKLAGSKKELGTETFLERRELGVINVGEPGTVRVDGTSYELGKRDCLYVGRGAVDVSFESADAGKPAKFYLVSSPAHQTYPTVKIGIDQATPQKLGSDEEANKRTIYKYIHPDGVKSAQLVMGLTMLEPGSIWNTMPVHTHQRRMEVYLYIDVADNALVFHYMGEPEETRHIVMRNEEAVISPSWSIHAGAGTRNYSFIWAMAGENQTFSDMDPVTMDRIR